MTHDHTDAAVRILTKTIRRLSKELAEADHKASIGASMLAETMTGAREEREERLAAEARWEEAANAKNRLDSDLANMRECLHVAQQRIDHAMNALTADFDADTRAGDALAILRGEA